MIHCFQKGGGGVEAYFKGRKLFYRLLTINYEKASNKTDGIELGEFSPNTWYFLAIEHEKLQGFVFGSGQITVNLKKFLIKLQIFKISKGLYK